MTTTAIRTLNFYRASEDEGGRVLARLARHTPDPVFSAELARHAAEEKKHAGWWSETMRELGVEPWRERDTYQARYLAALGRPRTILEVLALTQVFERRVYRHYLDHLRRPETPPVVAATLRRIVAEERHHISWVKRWLQAVPRPDDVNKALARYALADRAIYQSLTEDYGWNLQ